MSKSITFGIEGHPDQRTSATRVYTHAIVGYFDGAKMYKRQAAGQEKQAREDYRYYANQWKPGRYDNAEESARVGAIIDGGVEKYVAQRLYDLRARCNGLTGEGVLQWSQSEVNAAKACGSWAKRHYENLRVVPCFETKKRKGAPTISETPLTRGW